MRRIAFDIMGGDHAPAVELDAALALERDGREGPEAVQVILVGDEAKIKRGLMERGLAGSARFEVHHAAQVIGMDEAPVQAVRGKKDSSMRVCFELVKAGEADAVVSAGNSGAMLACGMFVLRRLPGAIRPGIVTTFPTLNAPCVLCDMGANVDVKPAVLAQFGVLGAVYAQVTLARPRPRVGLLSNGEEESKGTELTRGAHAILKDLATAGGGDGGFEYVGYVEGRDIFSGSLDVIATDGFTGNVVLKTSEGAAEAVVAQLRNAFMSTRWARLGAMLAKPALAAWRKKLDYAETGGAPLLGVDGLVMVCHGRSNAIALKNALLSAARFADRELVRHVSAALARHSSAFQERGEVEVGDAKVLR